MGYRTKLGWLRVPIAAFLGELALIALVIPIYAVQGPEAAGPTLLVVTPPLCLLVMIPFGWWAARKAVSGHVWIGALVGVLAALLYIVPALIVGEALPLAYNVGNGLKLVGGASGGFIAARRAKGARAPG
jgi:hypothetical protein